MQIFFIYIILFSYIEQPIFTLILDFREFYHPGTNFPDESPSISIRGGGRRNEEGESLSLSLCRTTGMWMRPSMTTYPIF